jgi:hypothetical protein
MANRASFKINLEGNDYEFAYDGVQLTYDTGVINTDPSKVDMDEEVELCIREDLKGKPYADLKIALNNAPYIDTECTQVCELIDYCIISLMGYTQPSINGKCIVVDREEVYLRGKEGARFLLPTTGTDSATFDYECLVRMLISQ